MVTGLLNKLSIPFASWYVDSPHLILRHYSENLSQYLSIFLWDEDYIDIVKNLGFENVEYLPLGTDDHIFRPISRIPSRISPLKNDISFVGNSMLLKTKSKLDKCGVNGNLKKYFLDVSKAYLETDHLIVRDMLREMFPALYSEIEGYSDVESLEYETAVTWHATLKYREALVKKLEKFRPIIVGDHGWKKILGKEFNIQSEMNYYQELPAFYNITKLNFNATSRQMKQGINQRIFDVPSCRGVVITDWTRQIENLMDPNKEIIAYKNADEIPELVGRLISDREMRLRVSEAGYRRVKMEHTYCHRLDKLVNIMKERYK